MTQVTVTVDENHLRSIGTVARSLEASGMRVDRVMERMGFITGSVDPDDEKSLTAIPGVASVDRSVNYQVPPPDSDVQ
ncbi:MAG TPA: hypothetical protein VIU11_01315 [Nakamurella sp.]